MGKTQYELDRDDRVKQNMEVFKSMGIAVIAHNVRDAYSNGGKKGKGKTIESDQPESDHEYDPSSDIDNESECDDDDDLITEVNTEVGKMVPGTRPQQKKKKATTMAATNQQPPRTPVRLTRQTAAMHSPGSKPSAGRPPPKPRQPLPTRNNLRANQLQGHLTTSSTQTTETTNSLPSTTIVNKATTASSSPGPNIEHSPNNLGMTSAAMSTPAAITQPTTTIPTANLSREPTPPASANLVIPTDNSPGARSSRQSNEISESVDPSEAGNSEAHTIEQDLVVQSVSATQKNVRKKTMGYGLEKMINRGKKLVIEVTEGKKRPKVPLQAAKLASECGVALRDSLPVYKSWKEYDNVVGKEEVGKVLSAVASRLDVDVKNEGPSKAACTDIIKKGVRQQRYHLKRRYFDSSLTEEQLVARDPPPKMKKEEWTKLVEYWCDPNNQEKFAKNKINRAKVKLHQKTGSRCYIAHRYSLRSKYDGMEPDPIQFFGECMTSTQSGRTPLASEIYEHMLAEKERQLEEGEEPKSPSKIVADNLSPVSRSSTFLPNIGEGRVSRTVPSTSEATERLQAEFDAKLQEEREEAARKQDEFQAQLQAQQAALEENQKLLRQTQEELKGMNTKFEETNALLRAVLKISRD